MDFAPNDALANEIQPIDGEHLTTWSVLSGGSHVGLDFTAADGRTHRIVLPFDALTGLLMTLPRMLQSALDARFSDGTLRIVQPLDAWQLEQAEGSNPLILKLGTQDGFEVAFALNDQHAGSLGAALLARPNDTNLPSLRRLH